MEPNTPCIISLVSVCVWCVVLCVVRCVSLWRCAMRRTADTEDQKKSKKKRMHSIKAKQKQVRCVACDVLVGCDD